MGSEIVEVKKLIVISGLIPISFLLGFIFSFAFYPNDDVKRNIFVGICVLLGSLMASAIILSRIVKILGKQI